MKLMKAGFTISSLRSVTTQLSIQWDVALYIATIKIASTFVYPALTSPTICQGIPSDFWVSIYNNGSGAPLEIQNIMFTDEANNNYTLDDFCQQPGSWTAFGTGPSCTSPFDSYLDPGNGEASVGGFIPGITDLIPFFVPQCVFDHPNDNDNNSDIVAVLNGMHLLSLHI